MGLDEGEILWLEKALCNEVEQLQVFEERYSDSASAYIEQNFPGGAEQVYDNLPDKAVALPRYIDPPQISESEVIQLSEKAAYTRSFVSLRSQNIEYVLDVLDQDFRVLDTSNTGMRGIEVAENLETYSNTLEDIGESLEGVAMFLDGSEKLPGKPFNRIKELYHNGERDKLPVKKVEPSDLDYPVDNYWPFSTSDTHFSTLN